MVAIHLTVLVVGTLSATLDKAKLYILSGMLIVPIRKPQLYNINAE